MAIIITTRGKNILKIKLEIRIFPFSDEQTADEQQETVVDDEKETGVQNGGFVKLNEVVVDEHDSALLPEASSGSMSQHGTSSTMLPHCIIENKQVGLSK